MDGYDTTDRSTGRPGRAATLLLAATLAATLTACTATTATSPSPSGSGILVPGSPSAPAEPSAMAPSSAPSVSDADVAKAVQFRTRFGLRADEAWARQVAADPTGVIAYGVPLLPAEQAELDARPRSFGALSDVLQEYGKSHPGEYGGIYVEPPGSNQFVVLFTGHLDDHSAALAKLVNPTAPIRLRLTPTAERDLDALMERISADDKALRAAGVATVEMSRDDVARVIEVGISTERPDAAGLLVGRYGPTVTVKVIDPTGAYLKAPGAVVGRVADASGKGLSAMIGSKPLFADIPMDSMGHETTPAGTYRLVNLLPGRWRITAEAAGFAPGSVDVDVPSGGTVTADIVLSPG